MCVKLVVFGGHAVTLDEVSNLSRDIMSSQTYQQRNQTMTGALALAPGRDSSRVQRRRNYRTTITWFRAASAAVLV